MGVPQKGGGCPGSAPEFRDWLSITGSRGGASFTPMKREGGGVLAMLKGAVTISFGGVLAQELDVLATLKGGRHKKFLPFKRGVGSFTLSRRPGGGAKSF